jgi:hypothetical protein
MAISEIREDMKNRVCECWLSCWTSYGKREAWVFDISNDDYGKDHFDQRQRRGGPEA